MYLRRVAVVARNGSQEVEAALATAGVTARLIPMSRTAPGDVDLVEAAVTGRDEATGRELLALKLTHTDGLQIDAAHDDAKEAWDG